ATGPSNVQVGSISFANPLSGNAGVAQNSAEFGTLQAGKSYVFDILIWAKTNSTSIELALSASPMGQTPVISTIWISGSAKNYRGGTIQREFSYLAKLVIDGSSTITSYGLAITISTGTYINPADPVTLAGGFTGQIVGSVTALP
ncbi:MAG: hypothetical protein ACKOFJ_03595, partial [Actinomycetota bacterium]